MATIPTKTIACTKSKSANQLCLGIIASGIGFVLRPADVFCAKAKRQQQGFICAKAKRQRQQHDFRLTSFKELLSDSVTSAGGFNQFINFYIDHIFLLFFLRKLLDVSNKGLYYLTCP